MKIKCGTDIIEISRVEKSITNVGEKFLKTIFTDNEINYCESKKAQKYQHYAARFAVKEAAFKALSQYVNKESIDWKTFEVQKDKDNRPVIKINSNIEDLQSIDVSISHCKEYATATVVAILKK